MNTSTRRSRLPCGLWVPALLAVSILLLAACQSSDGPGPTATSPSSRSEPTDTPITPGQEPTDIAAPTPTTDEPAPTDTPAPEQPSPEPTATPAQEPTATPAQEPTDIAAPTPTTDEPAPTDIPTPEQPSPEPTATPVPAPVGEREIGQVEGVTFVVGEGSEATFTVEEKLARLPLPNDAVVRTGAVTGEVHLDGRPSVIRIDLHQLESDQPRRDRYIRQRMFPNDPVATFTVDDVLPLPPGFTDGETVNAQVTGTLDIRGVQAPVAFEVEARDDGDVVFLLGRTSFVWADFQMTAPTIGGFVQVTEEVSVEVLLAVRPGSGS